MRWMTGEERWVERCFMVACEGFDQTTISMSAVRFCFAFMAWVGANRYVEVLMRQFTHIPYVCMINISSRALANMC